MSKIIKPSILKPIIIEVSQLCIKAYVNMIKNEFGDQCVMWKYPAGNNGKLGLVLPDIGIILVLRERN